MATWVSSMSDRSLDLWPSRTSYHSAYKYCIYLPFSAKECPTGKRETLSSSHAEPGHQLSCSSNSLHFMLGILRPNRVQFSSLIVTPSRQEKSVTATTSFFMYNRPFGTCQNCHYKRGVTVTSVTVTSVTVNLYTNSHGKNTRILKLFTTHNFQHINFSHVSCPPL